MLLSSSSYAVSTTETCVRRRDKMQKIRDFLKRITGVSTPFGGISWSSTQEAKTPSYADSRASAAFQLGRLVYLLSVLEAGTDTGHVSRSEIKNVRQKTLGFYSIVFGSDLESQAASTGTSLMKTCERNLVHLGLPHVEAAYWIGSLFQVYQLAHGNISPLVATGGLPVLARDRGRVLQSLADNSRLQKAAAVLYDHAEKNTAPGEAELARAREVFESYYV